MPKTKATPSRSGDTPATPMPAASTRGGSRRPAPRWVPDDSQFETSLDRLDDATSSATDRRFAALAPLPTPVAAKNCTQMWIPAARLSTDHSIDEILSSLAADSQPAVWRDCLVHLRDFNRVPRRGISFVCTSDDALTRLGNLQLQVCDTPVTIRKYSKYDKLYFVDLNRLPKDVPDQAIYDWFMARDACPILITPTYVHGQVKSRGRTVYFNHVGCPPGLFEPEGEPLREIYFDPDEKPCFVQHRMRKYNSVTPPSLRPKQRRESDMSVDSTRSGTGEGVSTPPHGSAALDSSRGSAPLDSSTGSAPLDSSTGSVTRGSAAGVTTISTRRLIFDAAEKNAPDWKLVQHSQYGVINRDGPMYMEPEGRLPCEVHEDPTDPNALVYSIPITPNSYIELLEYGYDLTLPPGLEIDARDQDEDGMDDSLSGFTADSALIPHQKEATRLKATKALPLKVQQASVEELQRYIDEFLDKEVLTWPSHEDTLAAIQQQPAYFRRIFKIPSARQTQLFKAHAVYRAISAEPLADGETGEAQDRLQLRFNRSDASADLFFDDLFPDSARKADALHSAICDLFLMIFAPAAYFDPVKIQAMIPATLPPKRLRHSPYLLWSDVNLFYLAHSAAVKPYLTDTRTPAHVHEALTHLAGSPLPTTVETGPSRLVVPQL